MNMSPGTLSPTACQICPQGSRTDGTVLRDPGAVGLAPEDVNGQSTPRDSCRIKALILKANKATRCFRDLQSWPYSQHAVYLNSRYSRVLEDV